MSNYAEKRREVIETVRMAVDARVSLIQLREKKLPARLLCDLAVASAAITRGSATRLLINDRADIALAANADGVHLAAVSLRTQIIRKSFPRGFIIGVSTHSLDEAENASADGADFVVFGPIYRTPGKGKPQGITKLTEVCNKLRSFRVLGLGGIDESNIKSVLDAGAAGFAAIRSLNDATAMLSLTKRLSSGS